MNQKKTERLKKKYGNNKGNLILIFSFLKRNLEWSSVYFLSKVSMQPKMKHLPMKRMTLQSEKETKSTLINSDSNDSL